MNILQVINVRWFNAEAAYAYSLAKGLIKKGHKVVILGLPGSPVIEKAVADGVHCYETGELNSYNPLGILKDVGRLKRLIDEEGIEVINCHRSEGYAMIAMAARSSTVRPVLIRTRGDVRPVRNWVLNRILYSRFADGIIASGEVVKNGLVKRLGLADDKIDVIYAAVDTVKFRPLNSPSPLIVEGRGEGVRKEFGISSGFPLIAILGRLGEVKGHRYFIEAAVLVLKDHPAARFLIIAKEMGEGADRLRIQIRNAGLEGKVLFTGFREDITDVMASCDIGVVASIGSETNCRVVLEWMAMGKPVVGTTVGVIPEVLKENETGYLVPSQDSLSLAKAINALVENKEKAVSFGKMGRKLVETVYNEDLFVEKTLDVYKKSIDWRKIR